MKHGHHDANAPLVRASPQERVVISVQQRFTLGKINNLSLMLTHSHAIALRQMIEHFQDSLDAKESVRFRASQRRKAERDELVLQLANVVTSQREVVNQIVHTLLVRRMPCVYLLPKLRFLVN